MFEQSKQRKIFRHVLKGLQFYHMVDGSGCTLDELVSYVYLKNNRIIKPFHVRKMVKEVLEAFKVSHLVQNDCWGNYELHHILLEGPFDCDEQHVVQPTNSYRDQGQGSSNETLSEVPHYVNVLQRKGTDFQLPKHKELSKEAVDNESGAINTISDAGSPSH
ncbi:uncharacterized protein LOC128274297 [Anopheles cruzii]|uniref:uncharacterized protein LOC128274297 n=1 Tax=Anopheles cruzii TaxID=68878 RepID=UPI0022EC3BFF|nr:uncharacterized protein LOC128274297 [Anopheles cruzii]